VPDVTRSWPLLEIWRAELGWIKRWGVSIVSFVGGCLTLLVFRRGLPGVGWIIGYLVLLWVLFVVLTQVRHALMARGRRLLVAAADYTIQTLYHGLLLFALPAYYASATLSSVNGFFVLLLLVLALLATFDPLYQALVHPRPWLGLLFFVVSTFAALALALPLIGVPPFVSLLVSACASVLVLAPEIRRLREWSWRRSLGVAGGLALVAAAVVGVFRAWIPPAPLTVARALITDRVDALEPGPPLAGPISAADLRRPGGVAAYTAIYAPASLRETIVHVWRLEGTVQDVVRLSPVQGGRREGFRTYSRKSNFPADPVGRWTVDVLTSSGQLIGRLRFRVIP
jgi:hypothetical protein